MAFCPNCRDEFTVGVTVCPDCRLALVPEQHEPPDTNVPWDKTPGMWPKDWPEDESGQPLPRALLLDTIEEHELNNALMKLRGYGVPCFAIPAVGAIVMPQIVGRNLYGGMIYVPEPLLEDARVLLTPAPIDESEIFAACEEDNI